MLFAALLAVNGTVQLLTEWWWFDAVGFGSAWRSITATRFFLVAAFTGLFFVILWSNLYVVDRFAPPFEPGESGDEVVDRYQRSVGPYLGQLRFLVSALFALVAGLNTSTRWATWMLFLNGGDFGRRDPLFGRDAGFYVFRLPFWAYLVDWLFAALVFTFLLSLIAHYLNGALRSGGFGSWGPAPKYHVSLLLVALALLRAVAYWLDRFELVVSNRGGFTGALATDVNVQLPALNLLILVSLVGAVLFAVNMARPGWGLPIVAVGLWALTHLIVGGIYPAFYQQIRVESADRAAREDEFVERNIEATRFAYGLDEDRLQVVDFDYSEVLTGEEVEGNADVISDVAIVDPHLTAPLFTRSQSEREYFDFSDPLDVDRYRVGDEIEPVVLSVRSIDVAATSTGSWENRHVVYTHGNGVVVSSADRLDPDREPHVLFQGLGEDLGPTNPDFEVGDVEPYVYYSENLPGYALVGVDQVDYPDDAGGLFDDSYAGQGGVRLDSAFRRAAYALRFGEIRLVSSEAISAEARIVYWRDIDERLRRLAPFLAFDSDPYPALIGDRIVWIVDAYTWTNQYPYSEVADTQTLASADLNGGYNYVRNSVKAVVDAYDGTATFYVTDDDDPIINAWQATFPSMFEPVSEAPAELVAHWRYPTDLFKVQTEMWATYQVPNAGRLIQQNLAWSVAREPSARVQPTSQVATTTTTLVGGLAQTTTTGVLTGAMAPQYRVTRLPGESEAEYVVQRAFVPRSSQESGAERSELTAMMVGRSDPGHYGELLLYQLPAGRVPAPELVDAEMRNAASEFITALRSSTVDFGRMQLVLLDNNLLYVRPLYITDNSGSGVPELSRVIVSDGTKIALGTSALDAFAQLVELRVPTAVLDPDLGDIDPSMSTEAMSAAELLALTGELLERADMMDTNGDNEAADELRQRAQAALGELEQLLGVEPATDPETESGGT